MGLLPDGNGTATGYTVTVTDVITGKVVKTLKVSKSATECTVKGLKPNTEYTVTVKANTDKNYTVGLNSVAVEVKTAGQITISNKSLVKTGTNSFSLNLGINLKECSGYVNFSVSGSGSVWGVDYKGKPKLYTDSFSTSGRVYFGDQGMMMASVALSNDPSLMAFFANADGTFVPLNQKFLQKRVR